MMKSPIEPSWVSASSSCYESWEVVREALDFCTLLSCISQSGLVGRLVNVCVILYSLIMMDPGEALI